ncbi:hypothetical protein I010_00905 [Pasteurella multocida 1500C]|nr:hypothetical protein PMCN06_1117 [Pasteurella multocida subsp. multocida str. HN06]AHE64515.1 hypothetical protein PMCN03_1060 [Pasteurella multocida subsp. multocida str. HB03]AKD39857.1 hypothetical protein I927_03120 [Pasteurella multocida OH1905]EGP02715.1 hypothetical protein GEW_01209 [Pasteurella multocida subsp. gallicida str. Anand1_poultry]EJS85591.1 hypothetical protein KCU_00984 [Pasteurella multocida subsp. multocida str. P52VAC]EJS91729.1 hypothetical protein AAUPMC_01997 [Pas
MRIMVKDLGENKKKKMANANIFFKIVGEESH